MLKKTKLTISERKEQEKLFFGKKELKRRIILGILFHKPSQEFIGIIKRKNSFLSS